MSTFPKSAAAQIAQVAIELAAASKSSLASGNPRPHVSGGVVAVVRIRTLNH
jgi:hypothetical protein